MTKICATESSRAVGERVRALREERNLAVETLAHVTGLEPELLRNLEAGRAYPAIEPLRQLADTLGVRMETFLDDDSLTDPVICHLGSEFSPCEEDAACKFESGPAYVYRALGKGRGKRNMEPYCLEIFPHPETEKQMLAQKGAEFILVLEGNLEFIHGEKSYALKKGDTVYYDSATPHYYGALGQTPCKILMISHDPEEWDY